MEFILAKTAGFCWGVRRALNKTLEIDLSRGAKATTLGPLVHNRQVIELLAYRGVRSAERVEEICGGVAIVRTHGVTPELMERLKDRADQVLDNTCPVVRRVQKLVLSHARRGTFIVIYGEPEHPEVVALVGHAGDRVQVIRNAEDLDSISEKKKVLLVTQTTNNVQVWQKIMEKARQRFQELVVRDTMCDATVERQAEILDLCRRVDAMVVIGGKNSGNTARLARIAREQFHLPTWHVESEEELHGVDFTPYDKVGVTAGASTPSWSIDRVMAYLQTLEDESRSPLFSRGRQVLATLVITNVFASLAAGALCYVGAILQGIPFRPTFFWLVFSYVLSMHVLNRFTEKGLDRFRDDPTRVRFYEKHTTFMKGLGIGAGVVALAISVDMGVLPFLMILFASVVGVLYAVQIVPARYGGLLGFRRLKDIAASKSLFVALAWAVVSVFPLFFFSPKAEIVRTLLVFAFLFLLTAIRSVVMDLTDMNADRLVGRETLPMVLGEKKTARALRNAGVLLSLMLFALAGMGIFPALAWLLAFWALGETLWFSRHGIPTQRVSVVRRDFLVDSHFIAIALATLAWNAF